MQSQRGKKGERTIRAARPQCGETGHCGRSRRRLLRPLGLDSDCHWQLLRIARSAISRPFTERRQTLSGRPASDPWAVKMQATPTPPDRRLFVMTSNCTADSSSGDLLGLRAAAQPTEWSVTKLRFLWNQPLPNGPIGYPGSVISPVESAQRFRAGVPSGSVRERYDVVEIQRHIATDEHG